MAAGHFLLHMLSAGQDLVRCRAKVRLILCLLMAAEDGSVAWILGDLFLEGMILRPYLDTCKNDVKRNNFIELLNLQSVFEKV